MMWIRTTSKSGLLETGSEILIKSRKVVEHKKKKSQVWVNHNTVAVKSLNQSKIYMSKVDSISNHLPTVKAYRSVHVALRWKRNF